MKKKTANPEFTPEEQQQKPRCVKKRKKNIKEEHLKKQIIRTNII